MADSNKSNRIVKNSALLYIRMAITMLIGIYTCRIIIDALGIVDYGIYNVVGGITTMFLFLNSSMAVSTSRFLTYEIGADNNKLDVVYNQAKIIHYALAFFIFLLIEVVGVWMIHNKLTIPAERIDSTVWVLHTVSVITVLNIATAPDNALIIAHERMSAFAFLSIFDAVLKLICVILLKWYSHDRLILYAIMLTAIQITDRILYMIYCRRNFNECRAKTSFEPLYFKKIVSFAGWNLLGNLANMTLNQGVTIVLNLFFGPVVNAARAVATQLSNHCEAFVNNIRMAVNPQITKSWAEGDVSYMHDLITFSSLSCFYMLFVISFPLYWICDLALDIWLVEIPEHSAEFLRLTLVYLMVNSFANPVILGVHATGDIKKFQIVEGVLMLLTLPFAYVIIKLGASPISIYWVMIIFAILTQIGRLWVILPKISMDWQLYYRSIVCPVIKVVLTSLPFPLLLFYVFPEMDHYGKSLILCFVSFLVSLISIWYLGLTKKEQNLIFSFVRQKIK